MTQTPLARATTETDAIRRWRLEVLVRAGYPPWEALVLSRKPDVDLHLAIRLVEEGCPVETAMRILV